MKIEQYKKDINNLHEKGEELYIRMIYDQSPEELGLSKKEEKRLKENTNSFSEEYQSWYSESLELVRQLSPSREDDFVSYYKPIKNRKELNYETYTVSDYLQGLQVTRGEFKEKIVGPDAAFKKFIQQVKIVESIKNKFESSLFDIRTLLQADLFDNELEAAEELLNKGFLRGAGAITGVVLEGHLSEVCGQHDVKLGRKKKTISNLNNALKKNNVIDTKTWRKIQHLGDIRNLCDHKKKKDPETDDIEELIKGVRKITKTIF